MGFDPFTRRLPEQIMTMSTQAHGPGHSPDDQRTENQDDDFDELEDAGPEGLVVEILMSQENPGLGHLYTRGLWWLGIPELCISLPTDYKIQDAHEAGELALLFARGLMDLSRKLIIADGFEVAPYHGEFNGRPVQIWLGRQEPVEGLLQIALGHEVDTLIRVHASLWKPADPGGD
jgi:hypothetical protein